MWTQPKPINWISNKDINGASKKVRKWHSKPIKSYYRFDFYQQTENHIKLIFISICITDKCATHNTTEAIIHCGAMGFIKPNWIFKYQ